MLDWISKHKVGFAIASATLACIGCIGVFFSHFTYNLDTPIENWVSTATYFNNLFSPILLFITMILLYLTWRDTKKALEIQAGDSEYTLASNTLFTTLGRFKKGEFFLQSNQRLHKVGSDFLDFSRAYENNKLDKYSYFYHVRDISTFFPNEMPEFYVTFKQVSFFINHLEKNKNKELAYATTAAFFGVELLTTIILLLEYRYRIMVSTGVNELSLQDMKEQKEAFLKVYKFVSATPELTEVMFSGGLLDIYFERTT